MIDLQRFAARLAGADLDAVILNLQGAQAELCALTRRGSRAEREAHKERCYMTAVVIGALIYELARLSGEDEAHARVLACSRLDAMAAQLSRGLLFVHPGQQEPA